MGLFYRLKNHLALGVILLIYLIIATAHSVTVPLTTGNDEWAHFLYVRFITEHGRLPATLAERAEAGYKADAPPLYHLLVAVMTAGVEPTRLLRPLDSPRRQLADNISNPYALVHIGYELPPYRGEVLLWHLGRGVSILFGAVLIGLTYLTSLWLCPSRQRALLAAAIVAFIPAMIFHSSVLTYESLSAVLSTLFLLVSIQAISQPQRRFWWLLLGGLAGLAITVKYSAIMLPLEVLFVAGLAWWKSHGQQMSRAGSITTARMGGLRQILQSSLIAGVGGIIATSWWFGFLLWNFNSIDTQGPLVGVLQPLLVGDGSDTTSVAIAASLFGEQSVPAEARSPLARNYPQLLQLLLDSFWAAPVARQFILSPWLSSMFTLAALLGLAGLGRVWQQADSTGRIWLSLLMVHSVLIVPLLAMRILFSFDPREAAQGRHLLMPAASAIAILWVWSWTRWSARLGQAVVVGLLLWSVLGQVGWAALVYPPPLPVWSGQAPVAKLTGLQPLNRTLVGAMQLSGFSWRERPAPSLEVTLWWKSLSFMSADYLIEVTLLDQANNPVSYTIGHPVQGRYPTRAWEPGDVVKDTYWLPLTGPLRGPYHLQLRLLNQSGQPLPAEETLRLGQVTLTGSVYPRSEPCTVWFQGQPNSVFTQAYRLRSTLTVISPEQPTLEGPGQTTPQLLASRDDIHLFVVGPDWSSRYQLRQGTTRCGDLSINIRPRDFTQPPIPQPLAANFNDQVQLLGYDLPTRRIQPGQRLPLTLYWQALAYMGEDYQIFDNLLDSEQRRWGGYDRRPRDGYSTLLWVPGEVITDAFGVPVDPSAPNGIYTIDIGLYHPTEKGAVSIPLVQDGQPTRLNSLRLGPIKVGGPPPGVTVETPRPQIKVNQTLGNQITLLGYDVEQPSKDCQLSAGGCQLIIRLYWRADTVPLADYTTFLHLRDAANENITQKDTPPAVGRYPTSLWDAGEIIMDEIGLPLAEVPSGRYTPVVGLYNLTSGERLAVPNQPANEIPLEPIELP